MANKLGVSSYHSGDCGGSHGDYEHACGHGFGPKMQALQNRAVSKHIAAADTGNKRSAERLVRHAQKVTALSHSTRVRQPSGDFRAQRYNTVKASSLAKAGASRAIQSAGASKGMKESGWAAWRAKRGK